MDDTLRFAGRGHAVRRRAAVVLIGALALSATGALGVWAGRATFEPTAAPGEEADGPIASTVVESSVGRSLSLSVTLVQPVGPLATNLLGGVVTGVSSHSTFELGDELYEVAGVPVRVFVGNTPFYRDLMRGVAGTDVKQLQEGLRVLGYLKEKPDGLFGPITESAVRAWQRDGGAQATGIVELGQLVAVTHLPANLTLGKEIQSGALLSGGEVAVLSRSGAQTFEAVLSSEQSSVITEGTNFEVTFDDHVWNAVVGGTTVDANGNTVLTLVAPGGEPLCSPECDILPGGERVSLAARAEIVPAVTGPTIPVAAIRTDTNGGTYVRLQDGSTLPVTILASAQGMAVVDGPHVGQVVLIGSATPDVAESAESGG